MKHNRFGYTIVEVLLVLAITGSMLLGASAMLRGQQGKTQFQQTMRDIDSKIQAVAKGVGNNLYPDTASYTCQVQADADGKDRAKLIVGAQETGSNKACIFIGRAIQVVKNDSVINIYSVIGRRTYNQGGQTLSVTTFDLANPNPAFELTETYQPPGKGARLKSATYIKPNNNSPTNVPTEMAGFYNNLDGTSTTRQQLLAKVYEIETSPTNPQNNVANFIQQKNTYNNSGVKQWLLCYQSASNNQTALLTITPQASGIRSQLEYKNC
jgi:type II secretory pathway pseudopilin PulG